MQVNFTLNNKEGKPFGYYLELMEYGPTSLQLTG